MSDLEIDTISIMSDDENNNIISESSSSSSSSGSSGSETDSYLNEIEPAIESILINRSGLISKEDLKKGIANSCLTYLERKINEETSFTWGYNDNQKLRLIPPSQVENGHKILKDDELPVFHIIIQTVLKSSLLKAATKFGDINTSLKSGVATATLMSFITNTFTSTMIGQTCNVDDDQYDSSYQRGGNLCRVYGDLIIPKVTFNLELLVKNEFGYSQTILENGFTVENVSTIEKLFDEKNWIGYRIWYFIHDDGISPGLVMDKAIQNMAQTLGEVPDIRLIPLAGQEADERCERLYGPDMNKYITQTTKINNSIKKSNAQMKINREENREYESKGIQDYNRTVYDRLSYFNNILSSYGGKRPIPTSHRDVPLLNESTLGSEIPQKYINYLDYFSFHNDALNKKLRRFGICKQQRLSKTSNYIKFDIIGEEEEDNENNEILKSCPRIVFPINMVRYIASSSQIKIDRLKDLPFPWNFQLIDMIINLYDDMFDENKIKQNKKFEKKFYNRLSKEDEDIFKQISAYNKQIIKEKSSSSEKYTKDDLEEISDKHYTFSHLKTPIKTAEVLADEQSNLIHIKTPTEIARDIQLERFDKIQKIWPSLDDSAKREMMKILRTEGFKLLDGIFNTHVENNTDVVFSCSKLLRDYEYNSKAIYQEVPSIIPNYGIFSSFAARFLIECDKFLGLIVHHSTFIGLIHDIYAASADPTTQRRHGYQGDQPHHVNVGEYGTGKTKMSFEFAMQILVEFTIKMVSSTSECGNNSSRPNGDGVILHDEFNSSNDPSKAGSKDQQAIADLKSMTTGDFALFRKVLTLAKDKFGKDSIRGRKSYTIKSSSHNMVVINGNDREEHPDGSMASRFLTYYHTRLRGDLHSKLMRGCLNIGGSFLNKTLDSTKSLYLERMGSQHALVVLANKAIAVKALAFPNIDTFSILWTFIGEKLSNICPSISGKVRVFGAMIQRAFTYCVTTAVQTVFFSEVSPFVEIRDDGRIKTKSFKCLEALPILINCPKTIWSTLCSKENLQNSSIS